MEDFPPLRPAGLASTSSWRVRHLSETRSRPEALERGIAIGLHAVSLWEKAVSETRSRAACRMEWKLLIAYRNE